VPVASGFARTVAWLIAFVASMLAHLGLQDTFDVRPLRL
jgi:hypothetical protein